MKIVCVVHGGARGARFFSCFRCQMSAEVGGRGLQHHGSQSAVAAAVRPGVRTVGGWTLTPYPAVSMSDALSGARCPQIERTGGNTRLCSTPLCFFYIYIFQKQVGYAGFWQPHRWSPGLSPRYQRWGERVLAHPNRDSGGRGRYSFCLGFVLVWSSWRCFRSKESAPCQHRNGENFEEDLRFRFNRSFFRRPY